jgi:hypothetical protein
LNAGGLLCVAYCQDWEFTASADHCPIAKASDCDKTDEITFESDAVAVEDHSADCCPFTISFFAAPVEKPNSSVDAPAASLLEKPAVPLPVGAARHTSRSHPDYRGPPRDRRTDRIKHRVFRI